MILLVLRLRLRLLLILLGPSEELLKGYIGAYSSYFVCGHVLVSGRFVLISPLEPAWLERERASPEDRQRPGVSVEHISVWRHTLDPVLGEGQADAPGFVRIIGHVRAGVCGGPCDSVPVVHPS